MNEIDLNEQLQDGTGTWDACHGPGVYALKAQVPDNPDAVAERWARACDRRPTEDAGLPDDLFARLATAERCAYVGASMDVYSRLCDHVAGEVRQTTFLAVFPPERVVGVWPHDSPFDAEFNRAMRLVRDGWKVWTDGTIYG